MPKERRNRSVSSDGSRASPFPCSSSCSRQSLSINPSDSEECVKEWEEARCPVCMEHPHNAILLLCSSREKGCRPYMCDTSYRHSNCFDQFRKSFAETPSSTNQESTLLSLEHSTNGVISEQTTNLPVETIEVETIEEESEVKPKLVCPLCRGKVDGWVVAESARPFMDAKSRSCASEACDFSGTYKDLRKHARLEHPSVRPSQADPERQRSWRRLERQRDLGDLISTLQSSIGEERSEEEDSILSIEEGGWLTVFLLIRVFRPGSSLRSRSTTSWSGTSRARAQVTVRRRSTRLWGETHDGENGSVSRNDDNENSDGGSGSQRRRVRRRTTPNLSDIEPSDISNCSKRGKKCKLFAWSFTLCLCSTACGAVIAWICRTYCVPRDSQILIVFYLGNYTLIWCIYLWLHLEVMQIHMNFTLNCIHLELIF